MPDEAEPKTVEFYGEQFTLNDDVSEFALLEFAEAAAAGQDADSLAGMASLLRLVVEVVAEPDRARFRAVARRNRATSDSLVKLLTGPVEEETERPTGRSSDSSDGPPATPPKSAASSGGKVSRLNTRPDMLLAVRDTERAARSA